MMVKKSSLFILLFGLAAGLWAQPWSGTSRADGIVLGPDDQPIEGATITLRQSENPKAGPEAVRTDQHGHWAILGLAPGRWDISIEAEGCVTSRGWIQVPEAGPGKSVEVTLRPLAEISAFSAEGSPTAVIEWIEKGNSFLNQGHYPEARAEYQRALKEVAASSQPAILRAIARTYYKEGKPDQAVEALRSAHAIEPGDQETTKLLTALLKVLGREQETQKILSEPPPPAANLEASASSMVAPQPVAPSKSVPLAGARDLRGTFTASFAEHSPLSGIETYLERHRLALQDIQEVDPKGGHYDLAAESFEVYVPQAYDNQTAYGLLVWISPVASGAVARPETKEILDRHRLIWVGANHSGNERKAWYRYALALDAVLNMKQHYRLDQDRIYVAGYSGGGRVASEMAVLFPEIFSGGFYFFGCNFYREAPVPDRPGAHWPAYFPIPPAERLTLAKEHSRYVFLTGSLDFNRPQTKQTFQLYGQEGFRHVTYLEIPDVGHFGPVPPAFWEQGLEALDSVAM
jgi:tetratricopeptide (TPR) repeat protein